MPDADPAVRVSVLMPAYNHAAYIAQALDSVLMQRTPFPFEVVVGEDASTDGTRAVVERYAREHPRVIRPVLRDANVGGRRNTLDCLARCRGEYVAFLEGDDYWLSPDKLAAQVEALDRDRSVALAAHEAYNEMPDGTRTLYVRDSFHREPRSAFTLADVAFQNFLPTCSLMFRRLAVPEFPPDVYDWPVLDWLLIVMLAREGTVLFRDVPWGVRRVHPGGRMSMKPLAEKLLANLECIDVADRLTGFGLHRQANRRRAACHRRLADCLAADGDPRGALRHALRAVRLGHRPPPRDLGLLVRLAVRSLSPPP